MLVKQIWTANAYRNFNYLIACPDTGEALAIDPLDHEKCLSTAKANGWQITQILNTHEHHDHTGGNAAIKSASGCTVAGPAEVERIAPPDRIVAVKEPGQMHGQGRGRLALERQIGQHSLERLAVCVDIGQ